LFLFGLFFVFVFAASDVFYVLDKQIKLLAPRLLSARFSSGSIDRLIPLFFYGVLSSRRRFVLLPLVQFFLAVDF